MNVSDIERFEQKLLKEIDPEILKTISEQRTKTPDCFQKLETFFDGFTEKFLAAR